MNAVLDKSIKTVVAEVAEVADKKAEMAIS